MNRTERIYKIKSMLADGRPVRMDRFLAALEVSRPTVRRDLDYMRDRLSWPIVWDRDRRGYRVEDSESGRHELPGLWLSSAEAHALLTMHYLLADLQPRLLAPYIEPLKDRVEALLETPERSASDVMKRVRVLDNWYLDAWDHDLGELRTESLRRKVAEGLREAAAQYETG